MALDRSVAARFHRVLVEEIRRTRHEYLEKPFTVAEIYQSLVPYRTHRDRIGVEMNADYEEALLHLLGGSEEYLILDSQPARDRIRRELASSNPNTGVFREFAALTVRLDPERAEQVPVVGVLPGSGASSPPPAGDPENGTLFDDAMDGRGASPMPSTPVGGASPDSGEGEPPAAPGARGRASGAVTGPDTGSAAGSAAGSDPEVSPPDDCPDCGRDLPERAGLRFCPYCGVDVLVATCGACGEELDRSWAFCIACGTPSGSGTVSGSGSGSGAVG